MPNEPHKHSVVQLGRRLLNRRDQREKEMSEILGTDESHLPGPREKYKELRGKRK